MLEFEATIGRFREKGEKSGWTYIEISQEQAEQLWPVPKKSIRVKGRLDQYPFRWLALLPMGNGRFILPLNGEIRKEIKKGEGDYLRVQLELDLDEKPFSGELLSCLVDAPEAMENFKKLPKGQQRYFSNWIESAKTEHTKDKRISRSIIALERGMAFSEMIRINKKKPDIGIFFNRK